MKKPKVEIHDYDAGDIEVVIVAPDGRTIYIDELPEIYMEMIDVLIESYNHMNGYLEYRETVDKIEQVLKKAGVEL